MLDVENLKLRLGDAPLFNGISFRVTIGQRVCIAGRNGQGKSSLMKAILGQLHYDDGKVTLAKGRTLGYLPQDITPSESERPVVEEVISAIPRLRELERQVAQLTEQVAKHPEDTALLEKYGKAQAAFEALDGYAVEARARAILDGLGFSQDRMDGPLQVLSGGWLMRVHLAKLLLSRPDMLLLDEPTNHLDIESREWLLEFLERFEGAILLTSHDRYFLDHLVSKVFELESGELVVYHGNYTKYETQRAERIENLKAAHARQQRELKRQQEFIERNRARAATASNVQSRIKQIEKIEKIQLPPEPPNIKLRFPEPQRSGQLSFRLEGLGKAYGDLQVFSGLDLELPAGEKLAVVGVNGAGKTTLLKLLSARTEPSQGTITLGHNVLLQYFSQYEDQLPNKSYSLLQAMEEAAPRDGGPKQPGEKKGWRSNQSSLRTVLGCFLFSDDEVHKPIKVLSGGERARLKLARMLLRPSNLLIMDEPTNHLDLHSKDVLLNALQAFSGTVVFVSHDREFLSALATSVLEIQDGKATHYPCDYDQYRWRLARDKQAAAAQRTAQQPVAEQAGSAKTKTQRKRKRQAERSVSKARQRERRHLKKKADTAQAEVEAKEARLAELEAKMSEAGFFDDPERSRPVVTEHKHLQMEIDQGYEVFEAALAQLEAFEAEQGAS